HAHSPVRQSLLLFLFFVSKTSTYVFFFFFFFFQAEDGIRDGHVTGVQTCALPICKNSPAAGAGSRSTSSWPRLPSPSLRPAARAESEERRVGKECRSRWSAYH